MEENETLIQAVNREITEEIGMVLGIKKLYKNSKNRRRRSTFML